MSTENRHQQSLAAGRHAVHLRDATAAAKRNVHNPGEQHTAEVADDHNDAEVKHPTTSGGAVEDSSQVRRIEGIGDLGARRLLVARRGI